jgi:siroheme synthase-like protein
MAHEPVIYHPIMLNIKGKKCVVIGGGRIALRKVKSLLECEANVTVVSPTFHSALKKLGSKGSIHLIQSPYGPSNLRGSAIAIAATDKKKINRQVADKAKKQGILVNVVDDPEHSDFIVPSFFRRGDLTIAISTTGASPALAKKIRTKLEMDFGEDYGRLLKLVKEVRSELKQKKISIKQRDWQKRLDLEQLIHFMSKGQKEKARKILLKRLGK